MISAHQLLFDLANTVLPRALLYQTNDTVNALSYDIDAAKEELAQSAYPDGFDTTIIQSETGIKFADVAGEDEKSP